MRVSMKLLAIAGLCAGAAFAVQDGKKKVKPPELDGAVGWLNTDKPVRLADLKGKIVVLDFWTYC